MCGTAAPKAAASTSRLEVSDILREFAPSPSLLTAEQARVVRDLIDCRTEAFGGNIHQCVNCGHRQVVYNSCGNRHCPKCRSLTQARWLEAQQKHLLPVEYFHVVFTVPKPLHSLFLADRKVAYNLLFEAVAETLQEVALNPKRLGAKIGFVAVLHTWTQTLLFHPHIHCIVPGGGISTDGPKWVSCKPGYLFPFKVLSEVFRGKLLAKFEKAVQQRTIHFDQTQATALLQEAACQNWQVYAKPPSAGPQQVLEYLGRYTHRIAISNHRLVSLHNGKVTFRYTDRKNGNKQKTMTLSADEFVRRFLLHLLPRRFVKIRHYGLLANAVREKNLTLCRQLLAELGLTAQLLQPADSWQQLLCRLTGKDVTLCPRCHIGTLVIIETLPRPRRKWSLPGRATSP